MKRLLLLIALFIQAAYNPLSAQATKKNPHHANTENTYNVVFPKGHSSVTVTAYMLGLTHPVTFIVNVKRSSLLNATINEMSDRGNIRINQILLPNGKADGPFSKSIKYAAKRKGVYKIIVGGSNMQGDDWKGAFTMHVSLGKL